MELVDKKEEVKSSSDNELNLDEKDENHTRRALKQNFNDDLENSERQLIQNSEVEIHPGN